MHLRVLSPEKYNAKRIYIYTIYMIFRATMRNNRQTPTAYPHRTAFFITLNPHLETIPETDFRHHTHTQDHHQTRIQSRSSFNAFLVSTGTKRRALRLIRQTRRKITLGDICLPATHIYRSQKQTLIYILDSRLLKGFLRFYDSRVLVVFSS